MCPPCMCNVSWLSSVLSLHEVSTGRIMAPLMVRFENKWKPAVSRWDGPRRLNVLNTLKEGSPSSTLPFSTG